MPKYVEKSFREGFELEHFGTLPSRLRLLEESRYRKRDEIRNRGRGRRERERERGDQGMFLAIYICFPLLKFVSFKLEHFGILASCQIPSARQMPPVKLIILILEAAFSLLSSRLRYLEESRLRKRDKLETGGRERERKREE